MRKKQTSLTSERAVTCAHYEDDVRSLPEYPNSWKFKDVELDKSTLYTLKRHGIIEKTEYDSKGHSWRVSRDANIWLKNR